MYLCLRLAIASTCAAAMGTALLAADYQDERTIVVNGKSDGYRAIETRSGTKTDTPLLDVPQSVAVVTGEQIRDQAIRSMSELVHLFPGVTAGQGEGHRDQVTLRGNNSTADFFVDGLRDDVQHIRGFYNIERVEAHKGPNAMIFGRGGGGGVINRVTKGAVEGDGFAGATGSVDGFGSWYVATDANLPFEHGAARLNAFRETLANHRDGYGGTRWAINPVGGLRLGDDTRLRLGYEHVADDRVVDRGVPSAFAGTLALPAPPLADARGRFFGDPRINRTRLNADVVSFRGETRLAEGLMLDASLLWGDYDKQYRNLFAATAIGGTPSAPTVGIEAYSDAVNRRNLIAQANLEWQVATGAVDHKILLGVEQSDQDSSTERVNGFFDPLVLTAATRRVTVAATGPLAIPTVHFVAGPSGAGNRAAKSALSQQSIYLQDQIGFGEHVDLIVGLRHDRFDLEVTNLFAATTASRIDTLWSPRAGLVFKPVPQASLYLSWTRSFLPQSGDQFLSLDASTATLAPETFDNYELGAKWEPHPGLSLTAALYRLDRSNTRAAGPTPGSVVLTGAQRSEGVELGLVGRIAPGWQLNAGYAYTDARIRSTTSAAPAGREVAQVPHHQLSLWARHDLNDRLGLGAGLYHQSRSFATIGHATVLPAYTRIDAAAYYRVAAGIDLQLNVENLTNIAYFPTAHSDNNITPGAPRNLRLTLTTRF
jgi:catecholate siderophore receptor